MKSDCQPVGCAVLKTAMADRFCRPDFCEGDDLPIKFANWTCQTDIQPLSQERPRLCAEFSKQTKASNFAPLNVSGGAAEGEAAHTLRPLIIVPPLIKRPYSSILFPSILSLLSSTYSTYTTYSSNCTIR